MLTRLQAKLTIHVGEKTGGPVPARIFGNFLEHLGYAVDGGILAQALANPTFERETHLSQEQVRTLRQAGQILTLFYLQGCDPAAIPEHWSPGIGATGFGVCALDEAGSLAASHKAPFPWTPLGGAGQVSPAVGRIGGAVRLRGRAWQGDLRPGEIVSLEEGPAGIRQGIFLPFQRCLVYQGLLILRIVKGSVPASDANGKIELGLRRRFQRPGQDQQVGECLALNIHEIQGEEWQTVDFRFEIPAGQVNLSEPVDFFIRWRPGGEGLADLLVDRAVLLPADAVEGIFDPDVLQAVREWNVPLLRWPGGNFASYYHWRDGIGPLDRRPTRPNNAWGGLETNFFGTQEFIRFCRLAGAEPHITVNTGTGTAEEAADWVSFCNASPGTTMGKKRASGGDPEPYAVRLWEVGNEVYGFWQGGYHGGDENAARFCEFAQAMRAADPGIELIATGNSFDIATPDPRLDHTTADRKWNAKVIAACAEQMDYLSLHSLPANDIYLEKLTPEQACYSLMAQPDAWERVFLPQLFQLQLQQLQLLQLVDRAPRTGPGRPPIRLAITEWGVLGPRGDIHPVVENYGEVVYAGIFLNMCIRNRAQVPIANATGLLHGGCIRKAAGQVYFDPQYRVLQKYSLLAGTAPQDCEMNSPTYAVQTAPDLGLPLDDVPYVDAIACLDEATDRLIICAVNRHLQETIRLSIVASEFGSQQRAVVETMSCADVTARARLGETGRFAVQQGSGSRDENGYLVDLPPFSVSWIELRPAE